MNEQGFMIAMLAMGKETDELLKEVEEAVKECRQYIVINGEMPLNIDEGPQCLKDLLLNSMTLQTKLAINLEGKGIEGMMNFIKKHEAHASFDSKIFKGSN